MGVATEGGEILDALKKHLFYGKPLDEVNLVEEVGDTLYYLAIVCDELGVSFTDAANKVIQKLKARYGDEFSEGRAIERDLDTERKVLESA